MVAHTLQIDFVRKQVKGELVSDTFSAYFLLEFRGLSIQHGTLSAETAPVAHYRVIQFINP